MCVCVCVSKYPVSWFFYFFMYNLDSLPKAFLLLTKKKSPSKKKTFGYFKHRVTKNQRKGFKTCRKVMQKWKQKFWSYIKLSHWIVSGQASKHNNVRSAEKWYSVSGPLPARWMDWSNSYNGKGEHPWSLKTIWSH